MGPRVNSFGDGVIRDLITYYASRRLSGANSPLHEGHNDVLYWQPRVLSSHLRPTTEQVEDAFLDGAAIGLQILHCQSILSGMALASLLVHMAGASAAFTRHAAAELMPDLVQAIDSHRGGNVDRFAQLCHLYLYIPVCRLI